MAATRSFLSPLLFLFSLLLLKVAQAGVLPPDRIDLLYHAYDGGGAEISGPSVLVRKQFADTVSVSANYYVDMVSSASIDVLATASPYSEERTQASVGIDYLTGKTTLSLGATQSTESDYDATTYGFGISQDFFGDLTTLALGVSFGDNRVKRNGDPLFEDEAQTRRYSVSLSQIVSKDLLAGAIVESVIDEGYLNNPYRSVRYCADLDCTSFAYEAELYPRTRNSDALALRAKYYLPYRAALKAEARVYQDSWGIRAHNWALNYVQPLGERWLLEAKLRQYRQTQGADFYADLFPYAQASNFRARDKELSTYSNVNVGLGVTYELRSPWLAWFDRSTANLYWDHMRFQYDDFRDVTQAGFAPGAEPEYQFNANVVRLFLSFWY